MQPSTTRGLTMARFPPRRPTDMIHPGLRMRFRSVRQECQNFDARATSAQPGQ